MLHGHSSALSLGAHPGPAARLWSTAARTLQQHPFLIKTVASGFGFAFGDVLFQLGTGAALPWAQPAASSSSRSKAPIDWRRAAAMGGAGLAVAGPVGYYFLMWMEANIWTAAPHCTGALATKFTLDQVLGFALWHASLAALHEPHRKSCAELARWPARQLEQHSQRQRLQAAAQAAAFKAR
ncbi:hypothetical protein ABPG75_006511 [Micractinium tetrahymenae]